MLSDLLIRAEAAPNGVLLDLACGPGRVALDLANAFETVWAVDLEPEMVAVGKQEAARRGVGNITWFVGRAEDLDAPAGGFGLITIGEAFHRLDQTVVTQKAMGWLKPGGCLATLGNDGILAGREVWEKKVAHWRSAGWPWPFLVDGARTLRARMSVTAAKRACCGRLDSSM